MIQAAVTPGEITPASATRREHGAGVRYLDMTAIVVIELVVAMAGRSISRGVGEVEMLVMSAVVTALYGAAGAVLAMAYTAPRPKGTQRYDHG